MSGCSICLDEDDETNLIKTHCGHNFHNTCLKHPSITNCPICRSPLNDYEKFNWNAVRWFRPGSIAIGAIAIGATSIMHHGHFASTQQINERNLIESSNPLAQIRPNVDYDYSNVEHNIVRIRDGMAGMFYST